MAGLTLLVGVIGAVVWVRSDDFQQRASSLLVRELERRTGERAGIASLRLDLWPPALTADGLVLWGADGEEIVSVDHVAAPLVLHQLKPGLGRLSLVRPRVVLHLDEEHRLVEFRARVRSEKPMSRLPWDSLAVTGGELHLRYPDGSVSLTALSLEPGAGPWTGFTGRISGSWRALSWEAPVDCPLLQVGPDKVVIPSLDLDTALGSLHLQGEAPLQGDLALSVRAYGWLDRLNPLLPSPRALHGPVDLNLSLDGPPSDPTLHFALAATDLALDTPSTRTPIKTYELDALTAAGSGTKEGLSVERWEASWASGEVTGTAAVGRDGALEVTALGESLSLARALQQLSVAPRPWVDAGVDAAVHLSGSLSPFQLDGPFDLAAVDFQVAAGPVVDDTFTRPLRLPTASARGALRVTREQVDLQIDHIASGRSSGTAELSVKVTPTGPLDLTLSLSRVDLTDFQPLGGADLHGTGSITGRLHGPLQALRFDGYGDINGFSATGIPYADHFTARLSSPTLHSIELDEVQATVGTTPYSGRYAMYFGSTTTMDTEVTIGDGRVEDVVGIFLDLPGLSGGLSGTLALRGPFNDLDGAAHLKFKEVSLWGERFPEGEADGYMDQGVFSLDALSLVRSDQDAGLRLRGSVGRGWALNMELIGDGFRLEHLDHLAPLELPLSGRASLVARLDNTLFEPAPHGTLAITELRYAGQPIADSLARFHTEEGVLSLDADLVGDAARAWGTLGLWGAQPYQFGVALVSFPLHRVYPVAADGGAISAALDGTLSLEGHFGERPSPPHLVGRAESLDLAWGRHRLHNQQPWSFELEDGRWTLHDFSLAGGETGFTMSASGGRDQELALEGLGKADLDLLRAVVPGLTKANGQAQLHLEATGKAPDVETVLDAELYGTLIRHQSFPAPLEDVRASVHATRDGYTLTAAEAGLGGGMIKAWGQIEADGWAPRWYDLHAVGADTQILWTETLAPAIGDSDITFTGPAEDPLLAGDITISEMSFVDRIDWEDWVVEWRDELLVDYTSLEDEPLFDMDLHILADRTVRLRNNVIDGTASADLRVLGDTVRPGLAGDIWLHEGEVFLQDRQFTIQRGHIAFIDPWSWDPTIDFDLASEVVSREQRYRVNYLVHGPFSGWTTETRSDPPLAPSDINALLWFGLTTDELEEMGDLPTALTQGVLSLMLTDLVIGWTGEYREDVKFIVDRVDLVTGVDLRGEYSSDPRLLVSKQLKEFGDLEGTLEMNLVRPDDWYGVVEKDLSDSWTLSLWYASRPRARSYIQGALGFDVHTRLEVE
ncbi:MAG: translocation/assembly module TamB domain-containing protein [Deltaproteobacteria bacterium]|nr:translocation/assembly module TamB domain-containing protein [Deltaproteobacteria bacterium]